MATSETRVTNRETHVKKTPRTRLCHTWHNFKKINICYIIDVKHHTSQRFSFISFEQGRNWGIYIQHVNEVLTTPNHCLPPPSTSLWSGCPSVSRLVWRLVGLFFHVSLPMLLSILPFHSWCRCWWVHLWRCRSRSTRSLTYARHFINSASELPHT